MQKNIKNISIGLAIIIGINLIIALLVAILHYFNLLTDGIVQSILYITPIVSMFIGTFYAGRNSIEKGWLMGIYIGLIYFILMNLFMYLGLDSLLSFKQLIFFAVLMLSAVLGGMIGINIKPKENKK